MDSRHRRTLSPGSYRISNHGRASTGTFDQYDDDYYGRGSRDYTSSRLDKFYPTQSISSSYDPYAPRPRRNTYDRGEPESSPPRQIRRDRDRDEHRPRKERHRVYEVDDTSGARLVSEKKVTPRDYDYEKSERPRESRRAARERYTKPRNVDEDEYSYTDAASMYRDTEPRRTRRRGSADRARGAVDYDSDDYYGPSASTSARGFARAQGSRADDGLNGTFRRHETLDERSLSRNRELAPNRTNTYDPYLAPGSYEPTPKNRRPSSMMDLSQKKSSKVADRDSGPDDEGPRRSRGRYKDEQVQSRGFGIRHGSVPGSDVSPTGKPTLAIEPPPRRPTVDAYGPEGELLAPDPSDYIPRSSKEEQDRQRRLGDERSKEYEHESRRQRSKKDSDQGRYRGPRDDDGQSGDSDYNDYRDRASRRSHKRESRDYEDSKLRDKDSDDSDKRHRTRDIATAMTGAGLAAYTSRRDGEGRTRDREVDGSKQKSRGVEVPDERMDRSAPRHDLRLRDEDDDLRIKGTSEARDRRTRDELLNPTDVRDGEAHRRISKDDLGNATAKLQDFHLDSDVNSRPIRTGGVGKAASVRPNGYLERSSDDDSYDESPRRSRRMKDLEDRNVQQIRRRDHTDSDEEDEAGDEDYRRRVLQSQQELKSYSAIPPPPPPAPGAYSSDIAESTRTALLNTGLTAEPSEVDDVEPRSREKSRVRIVEPMKEEEPVPAVKSILRKPTEKFPDHPNAVREGVMPLKEEAAKRGIPSGARWTKIKRSLVNPEALTQAKERFEERLDYVIVLRVLSKEDIQALADLTTKIRAKRDEEYDSHKNAGPSRSKEDKDMDESDNTDVDDYESRHKRDRDERDREKSDDKESKKHRDHDRERERVSHHDRDRDRERQRDPQPRDRAADRERIRD